MLHGDDHRSPDALDPAEALDPPEARGRAGRSSAELHEVLGAAQQAGFLGDRPIVEVVAHARHFVEALSGTDGSIVDLGAGGGVPGLVVAFDRPDLRVTLIDRRTKRTDFLVRMVRRLGWTEGVDVLAAEADHVAATQGQAFDAAVARGFGPPEVTLRTASGLVRAGGLVIVSEPPTGDSGERWSRELLAETGLERCESRPAVAMFRRR